MFFCIINLLLSKSSLHWVFTNENFAILEISLSPETCLHCKLRDLDHPEDVGSYQWRIKRRGPGRRAGGGGGRPPYFG